MRVQPLRAVERDVLSAYRMSNPPTHVATARRERAQHPPRIAPLPRHREVAADRRDRQAEAEHEVRPAREPLGVAVEAAPTPARPATAAGTERIELPRRGRRRPPTPTATDSRRLAHASARRAGSRASACADCARRYSRSTMRLNPIAANRAAVNASTTQPSIAHVDRRDGSDARITPTSANGSANTVCGSFTKFAYVDEPRAAGEGLPFARAAGVGAALVIAWRSRATATSRPPRASSRRPSRSPSASRA